MIIYDFRTVLDIMSRVDYPHPLIYNNKELVKENIVQKKIELKKFESEISTCENRWVPSCENKGEPENGDDLVKIINQKFNKLIISDKNHDGDKEEKVRRLSNEAASLIKNYCKSNDISILVNKIITHVSLNDNPSVYVEPVSGNTELLKKLIDKCIDLVEHYSGKSGLSEHEDTLYTKNVSNLAKFVSASANSRTVELDRCKEAISDLVRKGGKYRLKCACIVLLNIEDAIAHEFLDNAKEVILAPFIDSRLEVNIEGVIIKYELGTYLVESICMQDQKDRCINFIKATYIYKEGGVDRKMTKEAGANRIMDMLELLYKMDNKLFNELMARVGPFLKMNCENRFIKLRANCENLQ